MFSSTSLSLPRKAYVSKPDLEMIFIEMVKTVSGKILRTEKTLSTCHIPHPNTRSAVYAVWSDTICRRDGCCFRWDPAS